MKTGALVDRMIEVHGEAAKRLPGASSGQIAGIREQAIGQFKVRGLPRMSDEAWRYTNIRAVEKNEFHLPPKPNGAASQSGAEWAAFDSHRLIIVDGWFRPDQSVALEELPPGLVVVPLAQVISSSECILPEDLVNQVMQHLGTMANGPEHGFEALNAAFAADGAVVCLKSNVSLDKPIELVFASSDDAASALSNSCNFLFAGPHARATVIERYVSSAQTAHMTVTSFFANVDESARIEHCRFQDESRKAFHIGSTRIRQHSRSNYRLHSHALGASLSRHDVTEELIGEHSACELNGLYIGQGSQHIDSYTNIRHECNHATSHEYYKGILDDRSRAVFHGRIRVAPQAQKTDSHQQNRNLLLSRHAEADTKPQLEIYADDVKCAHGATIGQLEEEEIFYLQSRGLSEAKSRSILTDAFASEIVERIECEAIRDYVAQRVTAKLHRDNQPELQQ